MLLQEQGNYQFSSSEETGLWKRYWDNDKANVVNQSKLVEIYLPLVANVAKRMSTRIRQYMETEELLSMGVVGLHKAIAGYKYGGAASFKTFAYKKIQGAILDDLRSQDYLTRTQRNYYKKLTKVEGDLREKLNRKPSNSEIADVAEMSEENVNRYLNIGKRHVNLDAETSENISYHDVLYDYNTQSPRETVDRLLVTEELRKVFKTLPERKQKILFLKHYQGLTLRDIADIMKISQGRVSQIYRETVLMLREQLLDQ